MIAKSSAESELYGVVRGACEGLGTRTLCEDLGETVGIVLELDATAAKGILDRTGLAKVRHIDVNCLWLQEQCAKRLVPLVKIPGEHNPADLMTKHLTLLMIQRHIQCLNLEFMKGRSDKAAKLHSVARSDRQESASLKVHSINNEFASVSRGDYWAEKGEAGRWVRVHTHPRTAAFLPWKVPGGPGRRTRLTHERSTRGVDINGRQFRIDDSWDEPTMNPTAIQPWTGRTIFIVDKIHTDRWGTDQRRQRIEAANLKSEKLSCDVIDLFDEEAHSRWTELSMDS